MSPFAILWPTFALVGLVIVMWFALLVVRARHFKRTPPSAADFKDGAAAAAYFRPVELPQHNLANLFELPVLYFALVPLLLITAHVNAAQVALAWAFVLLRAAHSYIHTVARRVPLRARVYFLSCAALFAMWIGFFVDMVVAAGQYRAALAGTLS